MYNIIKQAEKKGTANLVVGNICEAYHLSIILKAGGLDKFPQIKELNCDEEIINYANTHLSKLIDEYMVTNKVLDGLEAAFQNNKLDFDWVIKKVKGYEISYVIGKMTTSQAALIPQWLLHNNRGVAIEHDHIFIDLDRYSCIYYLRDRCYAKQSVMIRKCIDGKFTAEEYLALKNVEEQNIVAEFLGTERFIKMMKFEKIDEFTIDHKDELSEGNPVVSDLMKTGKVNTKETIELYKSKNKLVNGVEYIYAIRLICPSTGRNYYIYCEATKSAKEAYAKQFAPVIQKNYTDLTGGFVART